MRQQRRRLALLALVAAAGERGVSRDKLIAWLSPESTTESARHSLHQLLYYLRQQAGEDVFIGSDPLRLNPDVVTSDLREFDSAINAGSFERAVNLYKGPFLEGFHLADSPEFDEWAEGERSRLASAFSDALLRLAGDATARNDHSEALKWWRQLASMDPLSGRGALGLIRSLAAAGDAPAALVHARAHEALVRAELGSGVDPEVSAFVERLQSTPAPSSWVVGNRESETSASTFHDAPERSSAAITVTPTHFPMRRRNIRGWITSGVLAVAAGGFLLVYGTGASRSGVSVGQFAPEDQILVGDFDAQPRDSLSARALSEALRGSLGSSRAFNVVSRAEVDQALTRMQLPVTSHLDGRLLADIASRNGYEAILGGGIAPLGTGYVLSARLTTTSGKELASLSETAASSEELIPALERLSNKLRRKIGESASAIDSVQPLAQATTRSLRALQLYTQANHETRAGRGESQHTFDLLNEAIAADSTFAMAHRFLGIKLYLIGSINESLKQLRFAERYGNRLTEIERLRALSTLHLVLRDYSRSADEAESVLRRDPKSQWAVNQLGILYNFLGRYEDGSRIVVLRARIDTSGRSHAAYLALYAGRFDQSLAVGRKFLARYRNSTGSPSSGEARRQMAIIHSATGAFDSAEFYAVAEGPRDAGDAGILAQSRLARGLIREAFAGMGVRAGGAEGGARTSSSSTVAEATAAGVTALVAGDRKAAGRRLDAVVADRDFHSGDAADRLVGPVLALALAGRVTDARREFAAIERASNADVRALRHTEYSLVRGAIALAENRLPESIAALKVATTSFSMGEDACRVCALPWLGRAYDAAGQPDSAIAVYERYLQTGDPDRVFVDGTWRGVTLQRLGDLYAQRGDTARAVERLEQFTSLWKDANAELQPRVTSARRRISELRARRVVSPASR